MLLLKGKHLDKNVNLNEYKKKKFIGRIQKNSETNISTTQCKQEKDPRLFNKDEHQGRPGGLEQKEG